MGKLHCFVIAVGLVLCAGCHSAAVYPLQPHEWIVFRDTNRANEFRLRSGNDGYRHGLAVEITRPTLVQCQ